MPNMKNLKKAIETTEKCFDLAKRSIKPGLTEKQLANKIKKHAKRLGVKRFSFPIIVESGKRTRFVHSKPSNRSIRKNDLIKIDFGIEYKEICTDITRTFCIKPDKKQKKIHNIVLQAQKLAIKKARPGIPARLVDKAARDYFKKHKLGKKFRHGLGHGVGKKIHEPPRLSPKSKDIINVGTVFTIEPGLYIKGWGGVRIEDMFLMTKKGLVQLTKSPKKLEI